MVRIYYDLITRESGKHPDYMTDAISGWRPLLGSENPIVSTDKKCRDYSIKFVTEGLGLGYYPGSGVMAIDLSNATYLLGFVKSDTANNIEVRLLTDSDNYKYKECETVSGAWTIWQETLSAFSDQGSPDMENITEVQLRDTVSGYRVVKLDLFVPGASRYLFNSIRRVRPYKPIKVSETQIPSRDGNTLQQLGFGALTILIDAVIFDDARSEAQLEDDCDMVDAIHLSGEAVIFHDSTRELTSMKACEVDDYRPAERVAGQRRHYNFSARYKENTDRDEP